MGGRLGGVRHRWPTEFRFGSSPLFYSRDIIKSEKLIQKNKTKWGDKHCR